MRRALPGALALALALAAASADCRAEAEAAGTGPIREAFRESVVAITYTLRPQEKPTGGEGRKVENAVCGVLVDSAGLIVTSADPFPDPGGDPRATLAPVEFKVRIGGGKPMDADPVGLNRDLNLAYLRIRNPPPGLRGARFSDRARVGIGDEVILIGLLSRRYDYAPVFYRGHISSIVDKPRRMYGVDFIVPDLAIGGLVLTRDGEPIGVLGEDVIGETVGPTNNPGNFISIAAAGSPPGREAYPMIFPHALFAADLANPPVIEAGEKRAWLGIIMQPLNRDLIDYWKLDAAGGIIISSVVEGSPAERAGLRQGDILVELNGEPIPVTEEEQLAIFRRRIEHAAIGHPVSVRLLRSGESIRMPVPLGEAPKTAWTAEEIKDDDLGMTTREITIDDLQAQNLDSATSGVVVAEMEQAGWAQIAGMQPGDIIQAVNGAEVVDLASYRSRIDRIREEKPPAILFFIQRQTDTLFVLVKTSWPGGR